MSAIQNNEQVPTAQVVEIAAKTKKARRAHAQPGTMIGEVRAAVAMEMAAGRNSAQTAKVGGCTQAVVLELWNRHELRAIKQRLNALEAMAYGRRAA